MNDRPFGDRHGPTPDEMRHRFTVLPGDPELERAATERAVQAAEESARAAAWIDAHSTPATSGNAPTLNDPGEKFTPGVNGPAGLRDRLANALRANACNGDCGSTEEACARKRIQPCVWEHGVLTEVLGTPEVIADVALAELRTELDALTRVRIACDQLRRAAVLADGQPHTDRERGILQAVDRITRALDEPAAGPTATQATEESCSPDGAETEPNTWTEPAHAHPCTATIEGRATPGGRQVQCTREAGHPENHVGPKQGSNGRVLWTDHNAGAVPHRRG
jgi:hypothetical protein